MEAGLPALLAYAARIGRDPMLVQGATGNVSIKYNDLLWITGSGAWLADAKLRDILVPVEIAPLRDALPNDALERFVVAGRNRSGMLPGVETALHAALPHPVVVHVHCVETLAWAVRADAETALAGPLAGLEWCFVPYARPGPALTRAVLARLGPRTDVVVLGNHGLVVGGDSVAAAAELVAEVQRRLRRRVRAAPPADPAVLAALAFGTGYAPVPDFQAHAIALDEIGLEMARLGSFYPDHVTVLGPGISEAPGRVMWVEPGQGVLLRQDASAGAVALARCLADFVVRLDPADEFVTLSWAEEKELL